LLAPLSHRPGFYVLFFFSFVVSLFPEFRRGNKFQLPTLLHVETAPNVVICPGNTNPPIFSRVRFHLLCSSPVIPIRSFEGWETPSHPGAVRLTSVVRLASIVLSTALSLQPFCFLSFFGTQFLKHLLNPPRFFLSLSRWSRSVFLLFKLLFDQLRMRGYFPSTMGGLGLRTLSALVVLPPHLNVFSFEATTLILLHI